MKGIEGKYKKVLVDIFNVNETIAVNDSHISYIKKVFNKYKHLCEDLTEAIILQHDLSKYWFGFFNLESKNAYHALYVLEFFVPIC